MVQAASLPAVGGRYEIITQIGTGGLGIVYHARDRMTGGSVALKLLKAHATGKTLINVADTNAVRLTLAREFHLLASLRHPHVISVLDYGFDSNRQPFYTMELVEGARTILDAGRPLDASGKVRLLVQLLQALVYLHRRGVLHRDLKPSNILVGTSEGSDPAEARVKLLDFGLAQMRDHARTSGELPAGTLFYMAPEILSEQQHTEAADLYSVGMIAYELFAGKYPFKLINISKLIDSIKQVPPDMSAVDASDALKAVIERLLAKSPDERYADAQAVIHDLCHAIGEEPPQDTIAIRESFLQAAQLVGREGEMAALTSALEHAMEGSGDLWLIGGESGVGKTRLVDELRANALVRGAFVARGYAAREASEPYDVWRTVARRLVLATELTDEEAAILKPYVPDIETLLGRPVLDAILAPADAQARLFEVFDALLSRLPVPVVLILEDIQWIREESLLLLRHLAERASTQRLLLVVTFSTDQNPNMPIMLPQGHVLRLDRLSEEAIASLSEAMLGHVGLPAHVIEFLKKETEGNAFFLVETVRALAEAAGELDAVGGATVPQHLLTEGIRAVLRQKLARIPGDCHDLLELAAVVGRRINLDLLRAISPNADLDDWLHTCGDAAVMQVNDNLWQFAHEKLRDYVLEQITPSRRPALHRHVARAIERVASIPDTQAEVLAYHWLMAGNRARAGHYAAVSGEQAFANGLFGDAAYWLRHAIEQYEALGDGAQVERLSALLAQAEHG